jgi:peptidoglycan/LPS O-acetylase OafA/YrhL
MPSATSPLPPVAGSAGGRWQFLDMLRAAASHLIVWHHLAFYGPLVDQALPLAPVFLDWLGDQARMVVQVFFVLGGFGTAQHLARLKTAGWREYGREIARRYLRIGIPYLVILPLAVAANALAGLLMQHRSISAPPSLPQLLAHAVFAHDLLGYEPLTAGIWYLAIDFQLFAMTLAVAMLAVWWTSRDGGASPALALEWLQWSMGLLAAASLFWFNRDPAWDRWGVYFVGSYYLGMLAQWMSAGSIRGPLPWLTIAMVGGALAVEWRPRIALAAGTALVVLEVSRWARLRHWPDGRIVGYFGRISFSLFLIHFPVCLVVNAWLSRWAVTPAQAVAGMVAAWAASVIAAVLLHHAVERPCQQAAARIGAGPTAGSGSSGPNRRGR